jgi:hypothetical protein
MPLPIIAVFNHAAVFENQRGNLTSCTARRKYRVERRRRSTFNRSRKYILHSRGGYVTIEDMASFHYTSVRRPKRKTQHELKDHTAIPIHRLLACSRHRDWLQHYADANIRSNGIDRNQVSVVGGQ